MGAYTRQDRFYVGNFDTVSRGNAQGYASRALAPAEVDAQRAALYVYTRRFAEAKTTLDQAMQEDPDLPIVHESLGMLAYYQQDWATAETEFSRAVQLHSANYAAYFFDASSQMRRRRTNIDDAATVALLESAIHMNPQFAPAYAALSSLYSTNPETHDQALPWDSKAIDLEPGNLQYAVAYSFVLLTVDRLADAKVLAARIQAAARTPQDRQLSQQLEQAIQSRADYEAELAAYKRQAEQQQQSAGATNLNGDDCFRTRWNCSCCRSASRRQACQGNPIRRGRHHLLRGLRKRRRRKSDSEGEQFWACDSRLWTSSNFRSPRETRTSLTMHRPAPIGRAAAPGCISTN